MAKIEIIDTNAANIGDHEFCGFRDPKTEGHRRKADWLKQRFAEGLKFKVLQVDAEDAGMIEYTPGEHTWRPVDAPGYTVIHCIMIYRKKYKGSGTWMASAEIFRRCGFERVDTAPPSFELLVRKFRKAPSRTGTGRYLTHSSHQMVISSSEFVNVTPRAAETSFRRFETILSLMSGPRSR